MHKHRATDEPKTPRFPTVEMSLPVFVLLVILILVVTGLGLYAVIHGANS